MGFPCGSAGKESACNVGNVGLIPGLGRYPGEGKACPLQYSGLENSMECIIQGVTKSWTRLFEGLSLSLSQIYNSIKVQIIKMVSETLVGFLVCFCCCCCIFFQQNFYISERSWYFNKLPHVFCLFVCLFVLAIEAEFIFKNMLFFGFGKHADILQRDILIGSLAMK